MEETICFKNSQYLATKAQTRFSDFSMNRELHFSKCLMYFEKARFIVSKISGLAETFIKEYPKGVSFVVVKVDNTYLHSVSLSIGRNDRELLVLTRLMKPGKIGKLTFEQILIDEKTQEEYVEALIDVAVVADGKTIGVFSDECLKCLTDYYETFNEIGKLPDN